MVPAREEAVSGFVAVVADEPERPAVVEQARWPLARFAAPVTDRCGVTTTVPCLANVACLAKSRQGFYIWRTWRDLARKNRPGKFCPNLR